MKNILYLKYMEKILLCNQKDKDSNLSSSTTGQDSGCILNFISASASSLYCLKTRLKRFFCKPLQLLHTAPMCLRKEWFSHLSLHVKIVRRDEKIID